LSITDMKGRKTALREHGHAINAVPAKKRAHPTPKSRVRSFGSDVAQASLALRVKGFLSSA
jgi:hypothetical protein